MLLQMARFYSFLWQCNVCVCVWERVFHFFIHSSMVGHLGCFHVLAIVKIMLQWTWGCIYLSELVFLFPSEKYGGVELLDHMVALFLISWGTSMLFSIMAAPIYIPSNSAWGLHVLHILVNTCFSFFMIAILTGVKWYISFWFWFAFPLRWASFHVPLSHLYIFFRKIPLRSSAHF